ncbi:HesA/MoeB/ThiF family protein [Thermonema rossianum]|uniref:HesA/MoeB/ThiF family protein n=1 Tax=Thermonema rossianum TaxID=55505 RepID=UPI00056E10C4|nr:ThiF family adenylyltransferase [Thermonema rossianum]
MRYDRNYLYIEPEEQARLATCRVLLGGCGIGSNIAECALRLGFERLRLVDGDTVSLSNLNRQNYTQQDIGRLKAETLAKRLRAIHPQASIEAISAFIDKNNMEDCLQGVDIAVNALDFTSDVPFLFDRACARRQIPVIHPYNLGWAALAIVVSPEGPFLDDIIGADPQRAEVRFVQHLLEAQLSKEETAWLHEIARRYVAMPERQSPPQLAVGSWAVAALTTRLLFLLATRPQEVAPYPKVYWLSAVQ